MAKQTTKYVTLEDGTPARNYLNEKNVAGVNVKDAKGRVEFLPGKEVKKEGDVYKLVNRSE